MNTTIQENRTRSTTHPISAEDKAAMVAMRAIAEPNKGRLQGTAARVPFDAIMERVAAPAGVTYEAGTVGGVSGWWCRPEDPKSGEAILHIHGGWFNWGSAQAYRHLVGHFAAHAGVAAFVPDYRLAPEHPYPAAPEDVRATYFGLVERVVEARRSTSTAFTTDRDGSQPCDFVRRYPQFVGVSKRVSIQTMRLSHLESAEMAAWGPGGLQNSCEQGFWGPEVSGADTKHVTVDTKQVPICYTKNRRWLDGFFGVHLVSKKDQKLGPNQRKGRIERKQRKMRNA